MILARRPRRRARGRCPTKVWRKVGGGIGRSGSARLSRVNSGDGSTPVSSTGCRECPLPVSVRADSISEPVRASDAETSAALTPQ